MYEDNTNKVNMDEYQARRRNVVSLTSSTLCISHQKSQSGQI